MNKTVLIVWIISAAICLGFGIWYGVQKYFTVMGGFIAVAVGTVIVGVIRYRRAMKEQKNREQDEDDN